jgi:methionine synthase II (cobalamin-independent)
MTIEPGAMPWSAAAATSIGSFPGTESLEAARIVVGELPDFVHVAELPARGPGADMVGRTAGMLSAVSSGLATETTPMGWRFTSAPGKEMRLAQSYLGEDLDALEETAAGYLGPVKCQVAGPWTLAASIELRTGERALRDPAAVNDIAEGLAEAIRLHVADLRRRMLTATSIVVQLDLPALPAVLAGRIGTASGLSSYAAVDEQVAERVLRVVFDAIVESGAVGGAHCCSLEIPIDLIRRAGARFVSLDFTLIESDIRLDEQLGQAWESGTGIFAGTVPSISTAEISDSMASAPLRAVLHRLGLEDPRWLEQVAVTPACGLAGASPTWSRSALRACAAVGRIVRDDSYDESEDGRDGQRRTGQRRDQPRKGDA